MRAYQFVTEAKAGKVIKLGLFSDVHFDSPDCDRETLKKHFDFCLKDGRYILINGDWFDAIIMSDRKRSVPHLIENTDSQLNKKLEESYEFLKPYQKNILFMGRGNHEESIIKYNGIDLLQMLTTMLNMGQEHKILYGNYANFLRFTFKKKDRKEFNYDMYVHHGSGGNAPVTKGIIDWSRIGKSVNADLIWLGHRHNAIIDASDPVLSIQPNGEILLKNRQCIQTPSYQKGRSIDGNINFAERFYTNQALAGFGEVNIKIISTHADYKIVPEVKITTEPSLTIGKVFTAKLLQKTR